MLRDHHENTKVNSGHGLHNTCPNNVFTFFFFTMKSTFILSYFKIMSCRFVNSRFLKSEAVGSFLSKCTAVITSVCIIVSFKKIWTQGLVTRTGFLVKWSFDAMHCHKAQSWVGSFCSRIACVSAPSVYQKLRELHREDFSICIFEYDHRFAIYGEEFIFYDYNNPVDLPEKIAAHSFDIVIADPPYLSEECLRKTSETIKYLTRGKILLCTGRCRIGNTPPMTLNKALPRSAPQSPYLYSGAEMLPFSQGWREVSGMMPGTRGPALGECTRSVTCTHQRQ